MTNRKTDRELEKLFQAALESETPQTNRHPSRAPTAGTHSVPPGPRRSATEIRGRAANSLVHTERVDAPVDDVIDHRGRSKPLYARKSLRPAAASGVVTQPAWVRVLAAILPGAGPLAAGQVVTGLLCLGATICALFPVVFVIGGWNEIETIGINLRMGNGWTFAHAAAAFVCAIAAESLRYYGIQWGKTRGSVAFGALGFVGLPAVVVLLLAPGVVALAPHIIEPLWIASWPAAYVALFANGVLLNFVLRNRVVAHRWFWLALGALVITIFGLVGLFVRPDWGSDLARSLALHGFQLVPKLLQMPAP